jgi:hypothetical protein
MGKSFPGNKGFMTNYIFCSKDLFLPQSGIDTITVWLHPAVIACERLFHEQDASYKGIGYKANNYKGINLRYKREINQKTGKFIRKDYFIDIQTEAIDLNNDISFQVIGILENFAVKKVLRRPQRINIYNFKSFFMDNFDSLFTLDSLDFFFEMQNDDMQLLGKPNPEYSHGYSQVLKVYKQSERLERKLDLLRERSKRKLNLLYDDIEILEYPFRIEFSLNKDTCKYLNILNLFGTYDDIFLRHLPFLAHKYRHEVTELKEIKLHRARYLQQIIDVARERIPRNFNLHETPSRPTLYEKIGRNDNNFIAEFYSGK